MSPTVTAPLESIQSVVRTELESVNSLIRKELSSDVVLVNQVAEHLIHSGGKRIRPLLTLLSARAVSATTQMNRSVEAAVVIEFIHNATLLHDDVVDGSSQRRGRDTANTVFGNSASVLVGDFLYSRAFQIMTRLDDMRVMHLLADATNKIAEGEVMQLMLSHDPELTEASYHEVIYRKTACLFEAGAHLGALTQSASQPICHGLAQYGKQLGMAFQLVDDVLDYSGSAELRGKNIGDDLSEGKITLPLIHALKQTVGTQRQRIVHAIESQDLDSLPFIVQTIESSGGLKYTHALAVEATQKAKEALSPLAESAAKTALIELADFALNRQF